MTECPGRRISAFSPVQFLRSDGWYPPLRPSSQLPVISSCPHGHYTTLAMPSDIQVFVRWKDQTIFAGEDVECTITFKNVAESSPNSGPGEPHSHQRRHSRAVNTSSNSDSFFSLKSPFSQSRRSYSKPFHRVTSSLNSPWFGSHSFPPPSTPSTPRHGPSSGHKHKRSVSILSIDGEGGGENTQIPRSPSRPKPARGHGRSASLQVLPRQNENHEGAPMRGT